MGQVFGVFNDEIFSDDVSSCSSSDSSSSSVGSSLSQSDVSDAESTGSGVREEEDEPYTSFSNFDQRELNFDRATSLATILSAADNIRYVVEKAVDALQTLIESGADPEKVSSSSASLNNELNLDQEINAKGEVATRTLAHGLSELLCIKMKWIAKRELKRREPNDSQIKVGNENNGTKRVPETEYEKEKTPGAWSNEEEIEASEESANDDEETNPKKKPRPRRDKDTDCDICGKSFTAEGTLRVHKLTHLDDDQAKRPYACDKCDKRFTQAGSLSVHKRKHLAKDDPRLLKFKRVWRCDVCGKEGSRGNIFEHKKTHLGDHNPQEAERKRPFKCELCEKRFLSKPRLREHESLHTGIRPFPCKLCPMGFNRQKYLDDHMRNHSKGTARCWMGEAVKRNHKCTLCSRRFAKDYELAAHLKRHADDTVGFSSDDEIVTLEDQEFKCSQCWKSFDRRSKLRRHEEWHGGLPHSCPLCDMQYRLPKNLMAHMRTVHEIEIETEPLSRPPSTPRPFKCQNCPATFTTQFALDKHGIVHQGPSSFKCSTCSEEFASFDLLNEHKRSHDPFPFTCRDCNNKFKDYAELTEHRTVCHVKVAKKPPKLPTKKSCFNCGVRETSTWRRTEEGHVMCNSCMLYFNLHGVPRPPPLWATTFRKRNRQPAKKNKKKSPSERKQRSSATPGAWSDDEESRE